jgi:hypothetical protein
MNHQPRKENHVNTVQKAILRACWQEEQCDTHAPRPWLRPTLIQPGRREDLLKKINEVFIRDPCPRSQVE